MESVLAIVRVVGVSQLPPVMSHQPTYENCWTTLVPRWYISSPPLIGLLPSVQRVHVLEQKLEQLEWHLLCL